MTGEERDFSTEQVLIELRNTETDVEKKETQ